MLDILLGDWLKRGNKYIKRYGYVGELMTESTAATIKIPWKGQESGQNSLTRPSTQLPCAGQPRPQPSAVATTSALLQQAQLGFLGGYIGQKTKKQQIEEEPMKHPKVPT
eukprot:4109894-Amphidinium_carterae.1